MKHQRRYYQIEMALRAMRDSVIVALENNPRLLASTKRAFEERLQEATDALNMPEDPK